MTNHDRVGSLSMFLVHGANAVRRTSRRIRIGYPYVIYGANLYTWTPSGMWEIR